jgi:hypothetical protein
MQSLLQGSLEQELYFFLAVATQVHPPWCGAPLEATEATEHDRMRLDYLCAMASLLMMSKMNRRPCDARKSHAANTR